MVIIMSMGYGARLEKVLEDEQTVFYYYSCGNANYKNYDIMINKQDGEILVDKRCFLEPEIHVKLKRMPGGRKKLVEKRIHVNVPYTEYIRAGLIKIKNASGCWKTIDEIDIMALKLLFKLFDEYQEESKIPDRISWFS